MIMLIMAIREVIGMRGSLFLTWTILDGITSKKRGMPMELENMSDRITATVKWDNKVEKMDFHSEEFNLLSTVES